MEYIEVLNEATQIEVLDNFYINPNTLLHNVAVASGIFIGSIYNNTKLHTFQSYKMKICLCLGRFLDKFLYSLFPYACTTMRPLECQYDLLKFHLNFLT